MNIKTNGDKKFLELLGDRKLIHQFEYPYFDNGKILLPDFTIPFARQNLIVEVRDVDLNSEDKVIVAQFKSVGRASWEQREPYKRLRRLIEEKADQLKKFTKDQTLIVLYQNPGNFTVNLSTENILEAAYADHIVTLTSDELGNSIVQTSHDKTKAALRFNKNTHISAVAVIESHKPNQRLADSITRDYINKKGDWVMSEQGQEELDKLFNEKRKIGVNFDLDILRLRIFHNVFAINPLKEGIMTSNYDEEIFYDSVSKKIKVKYNGFVRYL